MRRFRQNPSLLQLCIAAFRKLRFEDTHNTVLLRDKVYSGQTTAFDRQDRLKGNGF